MVARMEDNGKMSFWLKPDELLVVQLAIRSALYLENDSIETWLYCLLCETLEEITGTTGEISLRKSAFLPCFLPS